jgi:anti-anti-sigma regulatory factor
MNDQSATLKPPTVVAIEGTFDPVAAVSLRDRIATLAASDGVVLDFTHVREVEDLGLGLLVYGMAADHVTGVRFRGLSHHHERMLRYLGVDAPSLGIVPSVSPAASGAVAVSP